MILLTISNRSSDDALIVHSVFINYSQWLLSRGSPYPQQINVLCPEGSQSIESGVEDEKAQNPGDSSPSPAGQNNSSQNCNRPGTPNGTIFGSFLGGGTPSLVNADNSVTIKRVEQGSSDTQLHFILTLASDLPAGTSKLTFQVSKSSSADSTIKSANYDYQIPATQQTSASPAKDANPPSPAAADKEPHK